MCAWVLLKKDRECLEERRVVKTLKFKYVLKEFDEMAWSKFVWLCIQVGGKLMLRR
jgi:hypothetical protein